MFPGEKNQLLSDKDFYDPVRKRFEAFRRVLGLTREQLAAKLNVSIKAVEEIEKGESLPDLYMLYYLHKEYGLDINWMLFGDGVVISSRLMDARKELKTKKPKKISVKSRETNELWELMKVPEIEKSIFAKMEQAKMIYKDQIEALQRCHQLTGGKSKHG
jgi:transcriptional regulator with XRE-family HTH domain